MNYRFELFRCDTPKSKKKGKPISSAGIGTVTIKQTQAEDDESVEAIDKEIDEKVEAEEKPADEPDTEAVSSEQEVKPEAAEEQKSEPYVTERLDPPATEEAIEVGGE